MGTNLRHYVMCDVTEHICAKLELIRQIFFKMNLIPNFVKIRLTMYMMLECNRPIVSFVYTVVFLLTSIERMYLSNITSFVGKYT